MQAIKTEYKGPTDKHGPRMLASCDACRIVVHYDHNLSDVENHERAAYLLSEKLGWQDAQLVTHHHGEFKGARYHLFTTKRAV